MGKVCSEVHPHSLIQALSISPGGRNVLDIPQKNCFNFKMTFGGFFSWLQKECKLTCFNFFLPTKAKQAYSLKNKQTKKQFFKKWTPTMPARNTVYQLFLSCERRLGEKRLSCAEKNGLTILRSFKSQPLAGLSGNGGDQKTQSMPSGRISCFPRAVFLEPCQAKRVTSASFLFLSCQGLRDCPPTHYPRDIR